MTYRDVAGMRDQFGGQLKQAHDEIHAIWAEKQRLDRAAEVLGYRQQAGDKVERLESPLARVKRLFSESARQEYTRAKDVFQRHDERAKELGATSEAALKAQRDALAHRSATLPGLEEKAAGLNKIVSLIARAMEGFEREHEREQDPLRRARRQRDREMDRGR